MSSYLKAELAATCTTLGRLHKGEYLIEPECIESVKDLIRYLKRDNEAHDIRRYLGESKVLQNDLIHIVKSCPEDNTDLFDVTLRLLINLTTPALLFFGEEIPTEKIARNIYLSLTCYGQEYKIAFCDVQFWNKICGKLTNLFETDWTERSADDGIQIERILMLLRNVLQVPADLEGEKRPENDITVHDKVLWALRQSQILELLLFVTSNGNEEQYYLNLLEIFSLILREQNPKILARCDAHRSAEEKTKDSDDLIRVRESEKKTRNKYLNTRNFNPTFIVKGMKSLSNNDVVSHKSLEKVSELDVVSTGNKKVVRARRNRVPVESERAERRSAFSIRLFLKEFCSEFLNNGFGHLMSVVKNRLDSGKSLPNDQTYYFWAVKFFLEFAVASDSEVDLIRDLLSTASFHFVQTSMENALEHLAADKKKTVEWIRRIHLILKAYHSLLETLLWMDLSKNALTRSVSREIKSQIFYVVEYREMTLNLLLRYDPTKFSVSYLRDLIETTHLFVKLLEDYSKQNRMVVQKVARRKPVKKKRKKEESRVTGAEKWEQIKDEVYDNLCSGRCFPEIPPFDAALDIPVDDQKGRAMKRIQALLRKDRIIDGIGLLRSARQVWPENDFFGAANMSAEEETMALQEICIADLGDVEGGDESGLETKEQEEQEDEEEEKEKEGFEDEIRTEIVEQDFDIMEYKKRLVNKRVVEGCGMLLKNYKNNSDHTNHCVIKLLHRIGWECCMPALLFQASLFWTLLLIMRDKSRCYNEINTFTMNLLRKFRKHAEQNPVVFLELLFWKDHNVAMEIQHGYQPYEEKTKSRERPRKKKSKARKRLEEEEEEEEKEKEIELEKEKESEEEKEEKIDLEKEEENKGEKEGSEEVEEIPWSGKMKEKKKKPSERPRKKKSKTQRRLEEEEKEEEIELEREKGNEEEIELEKRENEGEKEDKNEKNKKDREEVEEILWSRKMKEKKKKPSERPKKKMSKAQITLEEEEKVEEIKLEKDIESEEENEEKIEGDKGDREADEEEIVWSGKMKAKKTKTKAGEYLKKNKSESQRILEEEDEYEDKEGKEDNEDIKDSEDKEEEDEDEEEILWSGRTKAKKRRAMSYKETTETEGHAKRKKSKARRWLEEEEEEEEEDMGNEDEEEKKEDIEETEGVKEKEDVKDDDDEVVWSVRAKGKKRRVLSYEEDEE